MVLPRFSQIKEVEKILAIIRWLVQFCQQKNHIVKFYRSRTKKMIKSDLIKNGAPMLQKHRIINVRYETRQCQTLINQYELQDMEF